MRAKHGNGDAMRCKNPGDARSRCKNALRCAPTMREHIASVPESALEGALSVQNNRKSTFESTLGSTPESTPESTPISEGTLESTWGALSEISLFSAP